MQGPSPRVNCNSSTCDATWSLAQTVPRCPAGVITEMPAPLIPSVRTAARQTSSGPDKAHASSSGGSSRSPSVALTRPPFGPGRMPGRPRTAPDPEPGGAWEGHRVRHRPDGSVVGSGGPTGSGSVRPTAPRSERSPRAGNPTIPRPRPTLSPADRSRAIPAPNARGSRWQSEPPVTLARTPEASIAPQPSVRRQSERSNWAARRWPWWRARGRPRRRSRRTPGRGLPGGPPAAS